MVPQHHPAHRAPPDTIPHLLGCSWCGLPGLLHTRLHCHAASRRTCCRALYSRHASDRAPPELYSIYSFIQRCILYSYTAYTVYTPPPDGSYFHIHKITELAALTRSIAVHTVQYSREHYDLASGPSMGQSSTNGRSPISGPRLC